MPLTLSRDDLICSQNFIAGRWRGAADAAMFPVVVVLAQGLRRLAGEFGLGGGARVAPGASVY